MDGVGIRVRLDGLGGRDEGLLPGGLVDVEVVTDEGRDTDARLIVGSAVVWARFEDDRSTSWSSDRMSILLAWRKARHAPGGSGRPAR